MSPLDAQQMDTQEDEEDVTEIPSETVDVPDDIPESLEPGDNFSEISEVPDDVPEAPDSWTTVYPWGSPEALPIDTQEDMVDVPDDIPESLEPGDIISEIPEVPDDVPEAPDAWTTVYPWGSPEALSSPEGEPRYSPLADESLDVPNDVVGASDESETVFVDGVPNDIPETVEEFDVASADIVPEAGASAPSDEPNEVTQSTDTPNIKDRFKDVEGIEAFKAEAFERMSKTSEGQKFLEVVGGQQGLEQLIRADDGDPLTRAATLAEQAGLDGTSTGRIVHRVAEIRTIELHPDEVIDGTRRAEQRIDYIGEDGQKHHIEIDDVIVRGDKHYLRDYKPLNLQDFEDTEAGQRWAKWMEANVGEDFRQHIQAGLNPYGIGASEQPMPREIRSGLQDFLRDVTEQHKQQLDGYRELYAKARDIDPGQVRTAVRPYFVYR